MKSSSRLAEWARTYEKRILSTLDDRTDLEADLFEKLKDEAGRPSGLDLKDILTEARAFRVEARARQDIRRDFEWKVSLGLWAALAVAMAALINNHHQLNFSIWGRLAATAIVLLMLAAYFAFMRYIFTSNLSDKYIALKWEDFIRRLLGGEVEKIEERAGTSAVAIAFEIALMTSLGAGILLAVWG